ncbi:sodium-independent sulfate anion transporter-like [Arctopsyche grandis]|uniref:sodium-independent sulfate anion transporter-like n=1 Tax=Arctopsyche grandis TaxID=121162 RepID=UPI00406D8F83
MMIPINPERILKKALPITSWAREYDAGTAVSDLVAGITVALTLIPQSIAYASLAGLEPQYGLYSSFAGSFVYILFGTTPEINIGPTALLSLLTFTYTHQTNSDFAVLLCFLGGFIQLAVGFARLGFLVDFVSVPVVSGFTSAAALIIGCSQIKGLLGLSYKAETFIDIWKQVYKNASNIKTGDTVLSVICCIILLSMRQLKEVKIHPKKGEVLTKKQNIANTAIWFTSVGRNAAVVIGCTIVAYIMNLHETLPFALTGKIVSGLPSVGLPNFKTILGNETYTFTMITSHLGSGILVVPLIGIIANVAIAKAFSKGKMLDANQEIVALGMCNVVSGFVQSMPVNGSFARSAVSNSSGVRTPAAGIYTGAIVLMTLGFLTPYFYFIPKPALASVIVCAVLFMIDLPIIRRLWISSKLDLVPLFGTFVSCLFIGVEIGILIGIAIDIVILLYYNSRPKLRIERITLASGISYMLVTPTGGLFFPSANYVREKISKASSDTQIAVIPDNTSPIVVIDCIHLHRADWTSLQGLKSLLSDFKKISKSIIFLHCKKSLKQKFETEVGEEFMQCSSHEQLMASIHSLQNNMPDPLPMIYTPK